MRSQLPLANDETNEMQPDNEGWDTVIRPSNSIITLHLGEIWRYRDLLYLFTRRDIVAFYKQTILGPLWFFIQPIFTTLVFMLVFGKIAELSTDGAPASLFLYVRGGFMNYFSESLNKTATVFRDNANLFGKVYFPRILTPLSIVVSNLARFTIQLLLLLCVLAYYVAIGMAHPNAAALLFPLIIIILAILSLALECCFRL